MTATHSHPLISSIADEVAERWWVHLLRGLAAISFGILAIVWPGQTLLTLVLIYGAFALIDGFWQSSAPCPAEQDRRRHGC